MRLPQKVIAIDIEATCPDWRLREWEGVQVSGDVIQIGAVALDTNLSELGTFFSFLKPTSDYRNPKAMEVNGITEPQLAAASAPMDVLSNFEEFCQQHAGHFPLLASWGNYFDIVFMQEYYRKLGRKWPFPRRSIDLKSIAIWEASKRNTPLKKGGITKYLRLFGGEFQGEKHNALDDIRNAVEVLRKASDWKSG